MEEREKMNKEKKSNLDRIFDVIDENAKYPRFLCAGLSLILWTVAGSFITSDVILAALPENRSKNCTENGLPIEYSFANNWTENTAAIHFSLLCDREKLVHDFKTGTMMGLFPGVLLSGLISDKFGRKTAMVIFSFLSSLAALFTRILGPQNVGFFIIGRIFMNGCAHGASVICFVYLTEMSTPKFRTQTGMFACGVIFSFGVFLNSILGFFLDSWLDILVALSIMPTVSFFVWYFVPRSYRWLFSSGKFIPARNALKQYSKNCGSELSEELLHEILEEQKALASENNEDVKKEKLVTKVVKILARDSTRSVVLRMFFLWMFIGMYYFALLLPADLPGNTLVNNVLTAAMEGLGALLMVLVVNMVWCYRTVLIGKGCLLAGVCSIASSVVIYLQANSISSTFDLTVLILQYTTFFAVSAVFALLFVYTGEMFPTDIRATCFAICSLGGRFGSLIAPQIAKLGFISTCIPKFVFALLMFAVFRLCQKLPETKGAPLLQSITELEEFYKKNTKRKEDKEENISLKLSIS
ncbi:Oidioi.mRNA.OKI2018_I69.chr1.g1051.t1.cds [Oikopleura dioica]|uniref:Oidioi.mRNA.OKI2018_I69.chr1.g1051.t1.cds n=1 Tax=Oikopleura dioica TaxID=34765 RepID=A0ABN7SR19_OIKDI|nr:Oidioi.mRNA.OKI2018_I69.chr1.g1051.t1.cds [Oikopleura dioica]